MYLSYHKMYSCVKPPNEQFCKFPTNPHFLGGEPKSAPDVSPKRFLYPLAFVNFGPHGLHTGLPYLGIFGVGRSHLSNPVTDSTQKGAVNTSPAYEPVTGFAPVPQSRPLDAACFTAHRTGE